MQLYPGEWPNERRLSVPNVMARNTLASGRMPSHGGPYSEYNPSANQHPVPQRHLLRSSSAPEIGVAVERAITYQSWSDHPFGPYDSIPANLDNVTWNAPLETTQDLRELPCLPQTPYEDARDMIPERAVPSPMNDAESNLSFYTATGDVTMEEAHKPGPYGFEGVGEAADNGGQAETLLCDGCNIEFQDLYQYE